MNWGSKTGASRSADRGPAARSGAGAVQEGSAGRAGLAAALDVAGLKLGNRQDAAKVWEAAREHILGEAELTGTHRKG